MEAHQTGRSDDYELIMGLFLAAMSRPEAERNAFIQEACADDSALLADVQRRIAWEARLNGFLLTPVVGRDKFDRTFAVGDLVLHRFRILRLAGEGGMGVVYEAFDEKLGRRIALKVPRFEFRKRLSPEASKSLQVTHPNVCRVFEIHTEETETGEIDFLTMEFLEGETMAVRLPQAPQNWLGNEEGAEIARQLCDGLQAIHAEGIVHRDLKPGNIMLTRAVTGTVRAVIMDFGISQGSDIFTSQARGTPAYLAPELWKGQPATVQSDIYALGVLLYEMACGRKPFEEYAVWKERFELPPPPNVGEPIRSAIVRCLQPEAVKRFQSAAELKAALWKSSRRGLLFGVMGLAASGVAGGVLKDRYWPSSAVRLAVLPPVTTKLTDEAPALLNGFIHDLSHRFKTLRGGSRPLIVFPLSLTLAEGVKSADAAKTMFAATHVITTNLKKSNTDYTIELELIETAGSSVLKRWSETASTKDLSSKLFQLQSQVLPQSMQQLSLKAAGASPEMPPAVYADYLQGLTYARADYENAIKAVPFFERVIAGAPDSALGYAGLAEALLMAKEYSHDSSFESRALTALAKAEQLNPDLPHTHFIAARVAASSGFFERALSEYQRVTQLEPDNPEAYIEIGYVLTKLNRLAEAESSYQTAMAVQPSYYKPYLSAGMFYNEQRSHPIAEKLWLEAVRLAPTQTRARLNLAYLYSTTGRFAEAEVQTAESLKIKKTRNALENLAYLQLRAGRKTEAVATYEEAFKLGPSYFAAWAGLGDSYRLVGREADARNSYRSGLEETQADLRVNPRDTYRVAWCAFYHAHLGEEKLARGRIAQVMGMEHPLSPNIRKRLIMTYNLLQDIESVIRLMDGSPPDLLKELERSEDLSSALRQDPRFKRLTK